MNDSPSAVELTGTLFLAGAILHTFCTSSIEKAAYRQVQDSIRADILHLLGEVEIVFGLWASLFIATLVFIDGTNAPQLFLEHLDFKEPTFVFAIMTIASTRPLLNLAQSILSKIAHLLPFRNPVAFLVTALTLGPLLGSLITEPAAMTVTAILLKECFFSKTASLPLKYFTLGVLFVGISIGGTLTPFAAPPILMVAHAWHWDTSYMLSHFGWKAVAIVLINAIILVGLFSKELEKLPDLTQSNQDNFTPIWLQFVHLAFLGLVVASSHTPPLFMGIFLVFLGFTTVTQKFQSELRLRESLLVGFFLAGLLVLGGPQHWWLEPILKSLTELPLFLGTTALTAITDNAALTFLGSQIQGISESMTYALVAGAVAGGGLTLIANAPNPAGFAILRECFDKEGFTPMGLFLGALLPTLIAMACLWWLPSL